MAEKKHEGYDEAAEKMREELNRLHPDAPKSPTPEKVTPAPESGPPGEPLKDTPKTDKESAALLPSGKPLSEALPTNDEVLKVINEPEENIDLDAFIRELREEEQAELIETEAKEAKIAPPIEIPAPTGLRPAGPQVEPLTPRAEERGRLLDIVKEEEKGKEGQKDKPRFEPVPTKDRAVDMGTTPDFQSHSAHAIHVINALFANDACSEIHGDAPDKIFARYKGKRVGVRAEFTSEKEYNTFLKSLVDRAETMLTWKNIREKSTGVIRLADGSSLTLTFPPFTKYACFTVRKHTAQSWKFNDLVTNGTLTNPMANFLKFCAASRINMIIAGEMGAGKSLSVDAPVLTPRGWKPMGDIKIGDEVIGQDGQPTQVLGVYPQGKLGIYKVTFTDESSVECSEDHLWQVNSPLRKWRGNEPMIKTLGEIKDKLAYKNGNLQWFIPLVKPIQFAENNTTRLEIDPYFLGLLLGEGGMSTNKNVSFSNIDAEIINSVEAALEKNFPGVQLTSKKNGIEYYFTNGGKHNNPLKCMLNSYGLLGKYSWGKFVPEKYLLSSPEDRLSLLQGLLDTDGSGEKNKCTIEYITTSPDLAGNVQFLVQSLGGTCKTRERHTTYTHKGEKRIGRKSYRMHIKLPSGMEPFRLARKKDNYCHRTKYHPTRAIKNVEYVGEKEAQCIKVAASDGLFVTKDFIVTHNTTLLSLLTNYFSEEDRIALIQEVPEIFLNKPDVVGFTYYPLAFNNQYTIEKVIDTALYMRFDRLIVGEIHDKGLFYLLKAMRTGGDGSISTFHAGSSREVIDMMKNHMIMENSNFDPVTTANYIRGALDLVVILEHQGKQHRIKEISEVDWRQASGQQPDQIALRTLYKFDRTAGLEGEHVCLDRPDDDGRIQGKAKRFGTKINPDWFITAGRNQGRK